MLRRIASLFLALVATFPANAADRYVASKSFPAEEAHQAAACDRQFIYAISSTAVAKYDRATGARLAISTGDARHLNSGFLWQGTLYCAHSNYPATPEKSEIFALNPQTMVLSPFKHFTENHGSLTWCVHDSGHWWCTFARYGAGNAGTVLVKFDSEWRELGCWTYPPAVIERLGSYSISGGLWKDGVLLATGHDHKEIYRLKLPSVGAVLEYIDTIPSPFPGQGIALDPETGGLIGIDRARKSVVLAELQK